MAVLHELHGDDPSRVTPSTDLLADLGIDGNDAVEIFESLADRFGVDFSDIRWDRHFGPEAGFNPLALLLPSWWRWQRERIPVRVRDLAHAVVAKRWTMTYPDAPPSSIRHEPPTGRSDREEPLVRKSRPIRLDTDAVSDDPSQPAFLSRPPGAPAYHGFPLVHETTTDGWTYGAISEYECDEPQSEGDGFVVAPDGSRAGIAWATDTPEFYEILPPDGERWGVYGVCFPRSVGSVDDLVFNFRHVLPRLKERHDTLRQGRDG